MSHDEIEGDLLQVKNIPGKANDQEIVRYQTTVAYVAGSMLDTFGELGSKNDSSISIGSFYNKPDSQPRSIDAGSHFSKSGCIEPESKKRILEISEFRTKSPTSGRPILRFLTRHIMQDLKHSFKEGWHLHRFSCQP